MGFLEIPEDPLFSTPDKWFFQFSLNIVNLKWGNDGNHEEIFFFSCDISWVLNTKNSTFFQSHGLLIFKLFLN